MRPPLRGVESHDARSAACVKTLFSLGALVACVLFVWSPHAVGVEVLPSVRSRLPERPIVRPPDIPDDATLESSGAVIAGVHLVRVNVFDPTIVEEDIPLFRFVNRIHIVTRESAITVWL